MNEDIIFSRKNSVIISDYHSVQKDYVDQPLNKIKLLDTKQYYDNHNYDKKTKSIYR